ISIVAFFPAFFVAMTCGVCNAACTNAALRGGAPGAGASPAPFWLTDADPSPGLGTTPPPPPFDPIDPAPIDPSQPPPAFPPPPLDPPAVDPAAPAIDPPAAP